MSNYREKLNTLGIEIPSILLPKNIDEKWPVIACDQFTQDRDYWEKIKTAVEGTPSTLNLIFPEVFLSDEGTGARIANIHSTMASYIKNGVFREPEQGFIYIERDTPFLKKRRGLIVAIDLEYYEWKPHSRPLIRCTEGTVEDRLPPRMDIRRGAPLELPHVMLLIDDETDSLLPELGERAKKASPVYNTPLMMDSGNVSGWFLKTEDNMAFIAEKMDALFNRSLSRYGKASSQPFLFAVGDGNHSLAAAKGIWEEYKASHGADTAACRYALVEIENIYDPAIQFEPIHRLIIGADFDETISTLSQLPDFSCRPVKNTQELAALCANPSAANCFGVASEDRYALIETSAAGISTACLQPLLDKALLDSGGGLSIDYIHGEKELFRLTGKGAAILLPPVQKSGLFETIAGHGPLPRKSFSIGHSCEKRFYLECRELV